MLPVLLLFCMSHCLNSHEERLKSRFCARLAARTRGSVIDVKALVSTADTALGIDEGGGHLSESQKSLCRAITRSQLEELKRAISQGRAGMPSLSIKLLRAAMEHAPW